MICRPCMDAADQRAGRDAHCDNPGCTCGHRTDRYGTTTGTPAGQPPDGAR
jgi:hypothetical protein